MLLRDVYTVQKTNFKQFCQFKKETPSTYELAKAITLPPPLCRSPASPGARMRVTDFTPPRYRDEDLVPRRMESGMRYAR